MPRKIEHRGPDANFECLVPDALPELYVDGFSQLQVGMPVTRIMFHTITEPLNGEESEKRLARLSLVIPTPVLLELVANIATSTPSDVALATNAAASAYAAQIATQVQRLAELTALKEAAPTK